MRIQFFGHSTFLFEIGNSQVLMDPFLSGNPVCETDPLSITCDLMLISHGHADHILDAEAIAKHTGCKVISNYEISNWLKDKGVEHVSELNHGGSAETDFGSVKYVNAVHSSVLPDGSYGGNPGGFVLNDGSREFYYAGDTALTMDMELLGRYNTIDTAFLPIGDTYTMGIADGAIAAQMVGCKRVVGMHFDTFPALSIDHKAAKAAFKDKGIELILLNPGESLDL